jgi:BirA family biotin operon repressor/biotin-[acetyl-CoA-carboxylase] ligase
MLLQKWRKADLLKETLVVAGMQEKGRGRKRRRWVSLPEKRIYLSFILRPNLLPLQVAQILLIVGVVTDNK